MRQLCANKKTTWPPDDGRWDSSPTLFEIISNFTVLTLLIVSIMLAPSPEFFGHAEVLHKSPFKILDSIDEPKVILFKNQ